MPGFAIAGERPRLSLAFLAYWTVGAIFVGMLAARYVLPDAPRPLVEDHSDHLTHDHAAAHGVMEVTGPNVPGVEITATKDANSGWNVHVAVEQFAFAPASVNLPSSGNEGHAHIYVNGEKIARLYGPHYHLAELPPGKNVIRVTLNTNTHHTLVVDGEPIAAEVQVVQQGTR